MRTIFDPVLEELGDDRLMARRWKLGAHEQTKGCVFAGFQS